MIQLSPKNSRDKRHMKQSVVIIGAGSIGFEKALESVLSVHAAFSRHFKEGELKPWTPYSHSTGLGIQASNRLFTHFKDAAPECVIPIAAGLFTKFTKDHTSSAMSGEFLHTTENRVEYFERKARADGTRR